MLSRSSSSTPPYIADRGRGLLAAAGCERSRGAAPLMPLPRVRDRAQATARDGPRRLGAARSTSLVVPTSGSTGEPRLAHALGGRRLSLRRTRRTHALGGPGRWLLALPTTHIAGLQVLVRSLRSGRDPVVVDATDGFTAASFVRPSSVSTRLRPSCRTTCSLVPTQLQRLLDDGAGVEALWELDAVLVGGAAVRPSAARRAHVTRESRSSAHTA